MELFNTIITVIATLTTGGVIGTMIGLRYKKKIEAAKAHQEVETYEGMEIQNTKSLIELYKNSLHDIRSIYEGNEKNYVNQINELRSQVSDLTAKITGYEVQVSEYRKTIKELERKMTTVKLEVQSLHSQLKSNCDDCAFQDECGKYKARNIIYESNND